MNKKQPPNLEVVFLVSFVTISLTMKRISAVLIGVVIGVGFLVWQTLSSSDVSLEPDQAAEAEQQILETINARLESQPDELESYTQAAYAYLQLQRETQSLKWYQKAQSVADDAVIRFGEQTELQAIKGQVALGQHRFSAARDFAVAAITDAPSTARYYGILGDALVELGQYDGAVQAYQTMVNLRPNYGAYVRIAYLRELNGDTAGALLALDEAEAAGAPFTENIAWLYAERGRLLRPNSIASSTLAYERALTIAPAYRPAQAGLVLNTFWQGNQESALEKAEALYSEDPTATHAALLGDLLYLTGETDRAEKLYVLAEISYEQAERSQQNVDRDLADFSVVRNRAGADTTIRAERYFETHKTVPAAVTYARALLIDGEVGAATDIITPLLTDPIGKHDPLVWVTAGLLAAESGESLQAASYFKQAVDVSPFPNLRDATILSNY